MMPISASAEFNFSSWRADRMHRIDTTLDAWLSSEAIFLRGHRSPNELIEAMRYCVLGGGKRIRPLLVMAGCETFSTDSNHAIGALHAACAIEIIHAYSLIHDDLPCMDNDVLRRGRSTAHVQFGEALALLAGDTLQALAFEWLTPDAAILPFSTQARLCALLSRAAGAAGMAGGQVIDILNVGKRMASADVQSMHQRKTGALLKAGVLMGAACAGVITSPSLASFGDSIGLAFQVVDDILDVSAKADVLGKTTGKDQESKKPTYVSTIGLECSRTLVEQLHQAAMHSLDELTVECDAMINTTLLRELAVMLTFRDH
jgi:farnesyl diphosphate synthase